MKRNMTAIKKFSNFHVLAVLCMGIILFNIGFDFCSYQNYEDKMDIIGWMAAAEGDLRLDKAIELLKSDDFYESDLLEQYGYQNSSQNKYYVLYKKQCVICAACTVGFFFAFCIVLRLREKQRRKVQRGYLKELGKRMAAFRENQEEGRQDMIYSQYPALEGTEAEAEYIREQLEMMQAAMRFEQEKAYAEKEKTKGFATDLSHQLKTPVAALDTCFSVLEDQTLCETERQEFYGRCRSELEGLKSLLDALVQISYMETGMIQIEQKQVMLLDTLLAAVNRIYTKASAKQIELGVDYDPDIEQLVIFQDQKWLCEAFVNLLDNAVKYSPEGSEVRILVQKRISFVQIEIADQGIGIPKNEQHKVFQRFYRGRDHRVRTSSGSGVGLYLVRRIVEEHHGSVSVRSAKRAESGYTGSVFVVHLPA